MKLRISLLVISALFLGSVSSTAQADGSQPLVLKTSLTSGLAPLPVAMLGLEKSIDEQYSIEIQGGVTFGAYFEDQMIPAPMAGVTIYKTLENLREAKHPARIGLNISYRKISFRDSHTPCLSWEDSSSSGWFAPSHDCVDRPLDYFTHHQEHFRVLFVAGKRFSDRKTVWELDFGIGLEYIDSYQVGKIDSQPHPEYGDDYGISLDSNPWTHDTRQMWVPSLQVDLKVGRKLSKL